MSGEPRLDTYVSGGEPRAQVLLLHGGQQHSTEPVSNRHASWWRLALLARGLRSWAVSQRLDVHLLQYRLRGWNAPGDPSPVPDARWALDRLRDRDLPVVLVGHSMGGRVACRVADDPAVIGVVGLAPWLPEGEPHAALRGKHLHVAHGSADQWTSPHWSHDFVDRARPIAASATWTSIPHSGHFMFRRARVWQQVVTDRVVAIGDAAGVS